MKAHRQRKDKVDYRALFEGMLQGLAYCKLVFDRENIPVDFVFLEVNASFGRLTGLESVAGRRATEVLPHLKLRNPEFLETCARVSSTANPEKFEAHFEQVGMWFSVAVYTQEPGCFTAVFEAVTDKKKVERSLEDAKIAARNVFADLNAEKNKLDAAMAKDEAVLESIGEGLIAVDNDKKIMVVNKAAVDMMGWEANNLIGTPVIDLPLEDEAGNPVPLNVQPTSVASATRKATKGTYFFVRKDKTRFPVTITATPIKLGGKVIGLIELIRDATAEQEINRTKTEFVSLASHQLKTPPTIIKLLTERILHARTGTLTTRQKAYMEDIRTSNQRMIDLVNALLNVSRIELGAFAIQLSKANICEVVKSVLHELKPTMDKKKLRLEQVLPQASALVMVDDPLFRMVVTNLVTNAIHYTGQDGLIRVECAQVAKGRTVTGKILEADSFVITVSDTGCGIPKNQQDKLFTKFFRADNAREKHADGTGLGLYIAKSVMENSGGSVWFTSEENKGTAFYVSIPLTGMRARAGKQQLVSPVVVSEYQTNN